MSYSPEQLEKIATNFEILAAKKKLDPKAKVRNRGTVCVPAESAKDKKDHFPINDEGQARNALARVQQLSSAPWYNGSLEGLKALVSRKVHSKYPGIGKSDKKPKKSSLESLLEKYGQGAPNYDAGQPGTYNPTEQTGTDAYRFMQPDPNAADPQWAQDHAEAPAPPGMKWTVQNDERKLVPITTAPAAAPQAGGWTGERIDPTFQKMLGVNPDGKLGRQTQHALNRYKANRNMTNALAYEALKKEPEYATGAAMKYDDNSNTYTSSAQPAAPAVRQPTSTTIQHNVNPPVDVNNPALQSRNSLEVLLKKYE